MTRRVIAVPLDDTGAVIFAEIDARNDLDQVDQAFGRVADVSETLAQASKTVKQALDTVVVPAARTTLAAIRGLEPAQSEIEFRLRLSTRAGAIFASAEGEAHIKVRLTWSHIRAAGPM